MAFKICLFIAVGLLAFVKADLDLDDLEKQLQNSDWTTDDIEFDDSDEESTRSDKVKARCSCINHDSCGCCIKPRIFGKKFPCCINATLHTNETKDVEMVEMKVHLFNDQVAQYNFSIVPSNKMCKSMPGKAKFLSICMYNNNTVTEDNGLKSCTSFDLLVKETAALQLKPSCIQFKDNQLDFIDQKETGRSAWLSMKIKNPLKFVVDYFNKNKEE